MPALRIAVAAVLAAAALAAATARGASAQSSPATAYSVAVAQICADAVLFDGARRMGTRADAVAIAHAIRVSTARRLALVAAISAPPELARASRRWISTQRRLASLYARTWVRIFDTIDAVRSPAQRATLADRLEKLVHAPDRLKQAAGRLDRQLNVPDCTGGGA